MSERNDSTKQSDILFDPSSTGMLLRSRTGEPIAVLSRHPEGTIHYTCVRYGEEITVDCESLPKALDMAVGDVEKNQALPIELSDDHGTLVTSRESPGQGCMSQLVDRWLDAHPGNWA